MAPRSKAPRPRLPRINGLFVSGPIPLWWIQKAAILPGKSLAVGMIVFFYCGLWRSTKAKVGVTNIAKKLGISWPTAYRGLVSLERAGLIEVSKQPGCKSQIKLVMKNDSPDAESRTTTIPAAQVSAGDTLPNELATSAHQNSPGQPQQVTHELSTVA